MHLLIPRKSYYSSVIAVFTRKKKKENNLVEIRALVLHELFDISFVEKIDFKCVEKSQADLYVKNGICRRVMRNRNFVCAHNFAAGGLKPRKT